MRDIVECLRERRGVLDNRWPGPSEMDLEAAAEIERLRAALVAIDKIVHIPTKKTQHARAGDHYQADFDAIRRLTAPWRIPPNQEQAS